MSPLAYDAAKSGFAPCILCRRVFRRGFFGFLRSRHVAPPRLPVYSGIPLRIQHESVRISASLSIGRWRGMAW